jgi:hypothetical protein
MEASLALHNKGHSGADAPLGANRRNVQKRLKIYHADFQSVKQSTEITQLFPRLSD